MLLVFRLIMTKTPAEIIYLSPGSNPGLQHPGSDVIPDSDVIPGLTRDPWIAGAATPDLIRGRNDTA